MQDVSGGFYYFYLVIGAVIVYLAIPYGPVRKIALLLASYAFYWTFSGKFLFLLFCLSTADFFLGYLSANIPNYKRVWLVLSVVMNLGVLAYFKYLGFFVEQLRVALRQFGFELAGPTLSILVPIGVSFIVFHGIGYAIDCYRDNVKRRPSYLEYLIYIAYFPKLLAGPIARLDGFMSQLQSLKTTSARSFCDGAQLVFFGLFKKLVVAAFFSGYWNSFHAVLSGGPVLVYAAGACYALFLLADFSGYTDIARGVSKMLGIELPRNFNLPYAATSLSEFWRRWHMSLSFWLRDYLYIPLGGSRRGPVRTIINIFSTMLLCGLWHGAAWNFVIWGGIHGAIMSGERIFRLAAPSRSLPSIVGLVATWLVVCATWILFASTDIPTTLIFFRQIFHARASVGQDVVVMATVATVLGPIASYAGVYTMIVNQVERNSLIAVAVNTIIIVAIFLQLWRGADVGQFVYFRF